MARIKANVCECDCKMNRLYVRADGGKGWDPVGWMCDCGCLCMDEGEWKVIECEADECCPPAKEETASCC